MDWLIPLADLAYDAEEEQAVLAVLRSRWLTMGRGTEQFEAEFARMLGVKYALAVTNATAALHLACLALGLGPGDEVIVPSLSFVATANAVRYTGATVRFADILGPDELTISPAAIEEQLTPRTRAIVVMHYGGYPCRMNDILSIAARHHLAVIEDAAHAPGASLDGRALGTWGDVGCFSFFSNKNLATGEGGMLVTDRADVADKVRLLRSHGMTSLTWDRHRGHAYTYDVVGLGYNYRLDEIRSALGLAQLAKLTANNARRRSITQQYWHGLRDEAVLMPFQQSAGVSAAHLLPIVLPPDIDRLQFIAAVRAQRIQTSIHYPPIHRFTYYMQSQPAGDLPRTEDVARREVTLPLYPALTAEAVQYVIGAVQTALAASRPTLKAN